MSAGEKAIAKEMRREENERRKRIQIANKMMIPVSKKTAQSLNLISFDPSGVFFFEDNRWMKIFKMEGKISELVDVCQTLCGRIRITLHIGEIGDRVTCHLSLMETGELYEEVRQKMTADESEISKVVTIHPMSIDEAMSEIAANFYKDIRFSYASYVRGNKDWKKESFFEMKEEADSFTAGRFYGESFNFLSFPSEAVCGIVEGLKNLSCPMYLTMDLNALSEMEQADFKRAMEKKYNVRLSAVEENSFMNFSLAVVIMCDSKDATKIVEQTMASLFVKNNILIVPAYHKQKQVAESVLSFGLVDNKIMRNVSKDFIRSMLGGEEDADAKIEIRSDKNL